MTRHEIGEEWERDIRPNLQAVEHYAKMATLSVRRIAFRPAFVTNAQAEMLALEKTLMDALATVRAAQEQYGALPVEGQSLQAAE